MQKRWVIKNKGDNVLVMELSRALNINTILANLLVQRGVSSFDEAKNFFRPRLTQLHDPFLMKDMEKAVYRIEKAIRNREKYWSMVIMMWMAPLPWRWFTPF